MSLSTVAVTVIAEIATGSAIPSGRVRFTLTGFDINGAVVLPSRIEQALDVNGTATVNLWPNASGTQGTQYDVEFFDASGSRVFVGLATIHASNCNLHDVLNLTAPPALSDAQAAQIAAQGYAAQASTSATNAATSAGTATGVLSDAGFIAVKNDLPNIDTVATSIANVNTVAPHAADVGTVAPHVADVSTLAPHAADVSTLAPHAADVSTVAGIAGNVTAVAGIGTNVTTVAGVAANVTTVAGIAANVTAVAGDLTNVDAVSADLTSINSVQANLTPINTNAANIAAIQNAATNAATAQAQATNSANSAAASATSAGTAQAQAGLAQSYAASASSVVQQDLSTVNGQPLHRSPNAVVAQFIYDVSKDSDGGAWVDRVSETSWYNEPLNGAWLPATSPDGYQSELDARCYGATLGAEVDPDPTFASSVGWTLGSGASIASNTLTAASVATGVGIATRADAVGGSMALATAYQCTVVVGTLTAGAITVRLGNTATVLRTIASPGTYTFTVNPGAAGAALGLYASGMTSGTVTKFSIKPVTQQNTATGAFFQKATDGKFYSLNAGSGTTQVYRGNTAKFPRLSAIVAEASNVTIYDLTQPGRPMWMQVRRSPLANSTSLGTFWPFNNSNVVPAVTGVSAIQGQIWFSTATSGGSGNYSGLHLLDFVRDDTQRVSAFATIDGLAGTRKGQNIALRNSDAVLAIQDTSKVIVSGLANAVAMTVLPDAVCDAFTGLEVPTIVVGTAGGLSVIKDDGTFVNSASTVSATAVKIDKDQIVWQNSAGILTAGAPRSLAAGFATALTYNSTTSPAILGTPTVMAA